MLRADGCLFVLWEEWRCCGSEKLALVTVTIWQVRIFLPASLHKPGIFSDGPANAFKSATEIRNRVSAKLCITSGWRVASDRRQRDRVRAAWSGVGQTTKGQGPCACAVGAALVRTQPYFNRHVLTTREERPTNNSDVGDSQRFCLWYSSFLLPYTCFSLLTPCTFLIFVLTVLTSF